MLHFIEYIDEYKEVMQRHNVGYHFVQNSGVCIRWGVGASEALKFNRVCIRWGVGESEALKLNRVCIRWGVGESEALKFWGMYPVGCGGV